MMNKCKTLLYNFKNIMSVIVQMIGFHSSYLYYITLTDFYFILTVKSIFVSQSLLVIKNLYMHIM